MFGQCLSALSDVQRLREVVSLHFIATVRFYEIQLPLGFDALGHNLELQVMQG